MFALNSRPTTAVNQPAAVQARALKRSVIAGTSLGNLRCHSGVSIPGPTHLFSDLSHRLDTGSVQVAVVLSCLDEVVLLNVLLHLLSG